MMKNTYISFIAISLMLFFSCSSTSTEKEESTTEEATSEAEMKTEANDVEVTGFNTIEELSASVVKSLKERDYDTYYSHVMSKEMEMAQAKKIVDSTIHDEFLQEYGFALIEEEEYFNNLLHFYDTKNIDLDKVVLEDLEYTEYKGGEYHPLELYEVFVPIEMDYEMLIDFTVIKVDGKFYLTAELGI